MRIIILIIIVAASCCPCKSKQAGFPYPLKDGYVLTVDSSMGPFQADSNGSWWDVTYYYRYQRKSFLDSLPILRKEWKKSGMIRIDN